MATVAVIGAGISGLSAAYYLSKLGHGVIQKVILYEASNQVGGWIQSSRFPDGSVVEFGPRSIRPIGETAATTLQLVEELGLTSQVIAMRRNSPAARNRFIYSNGKLQQLPNKPVDLFRKVPPFSRPLGLELLKELTVPKSDAADESVYDFFHRRLGYEVANYLADPLCIGIFAGDAKKLSVRSCFPLLFNLEKEKGSIIKGMFFRTKQAHAAAGTDKLQKQAKDGRWAAFSFRNGLQALPDRLLQVLSGNTKVNVQTNQPVTKLATDENKSIEVITDSDVTTVDHVISAIPAQQLAYILHAKLDPLRSLLQSITAVDVVVINFEFEGSRIKTPAFGYLIPSHQNSALLGVIFDSCLFSEDMLETGKTRVTCMLGGDFFKERLGLKESINQKEIISLALSSLQQQLGFTESPSNVIYNLHKKCIPQYHVGHSNKLSEINSCIDKSDLPISLVGSSYDGVSVNDCIHNAKIAVENLLNRFRKTAQLNIK